MEKQTKNNPKTPPKQTKNITYDGSTPLKSLMQEIFIDNLLKGMNNTDAYRKAGYKSRNPCSQANQLMKNNKCSTRLAYRRAELAADMRIASGITEKRVIDEISLLAFSNMQDFLDQDKDGNIIFKDFKALTREQMAAVESVKITKTTTRNKKGDREYTTQHTQFKLHNKTTNLEDLGKHLGIFAKDNSQRNPLFRLMLGKPVESVESRVLPEALLEGSANHAESQGKPDISKPLNGVLPMFTKPLPEPADAEEGQA